MQVVVNVLATAWFLNCRNVSIVGMPKTDTDSNQHQTHSQIHLKLYKLLVGLCWNEYIFCMAIMALLHSDYRNIFNILLVWFVGYGWNEVKRDVSLKRLQHDWETFDSTGGRVMKYKLSCVLNKCHSFIIFLAWSLVCIRSHCMVWMFQTACIVKFICSLFVIVELCQYTNVLSIREKKCRAKFQVQQKFWMLLRWRRSSSEAAVV